jgi:hypothetical protein
MRRNHTETAGTRPAAAYDITTSSIYFRQSGAMCSRRKALLVRRCDAIPGSAHLREVAGHSYVAHRHEACPEQKPTNVKPKYDD